MKYILLLFLVLFYSCSKKPGLPQTSGKCELIKEIEHTYIRCPDGSSFIVDNKPGEDGYNGVLSIVKGAPTCENDGITILSGLDKNRNNKTDAEEITFSEIICNGKDGTNGIDGQDGQNGTNGLTSLATIIPSTICSNGGLTLLTGLDSNNSGGLDIIEIQYSSDVCNGIAGLNGTNGLNAPVTPYTPVGLINPCGDAPGIFDEVFIKMANGILVSSFSDNVNGKNTRFSILVPGTYQTTDSDSCTFTVSISNDIINESHNY